MKEWHQDIQLGESSSVLMSKGEVEGLCYKTLAHNGFSEGQALAVTESLVTAEMDGCVSHGIYRLIYIIESLRKGGVVADAVPVMKEVSPSVVKVDAKGGLSPLAFNLGIDALQEKSSHLVVAVLAINHCVHVTALWVEAEKLARRGLVSIACNPTHSYVAPYGGNSPLLGTNPFAFGWPRESGFPFVFDFATSTIARGDVELYHRAKMPIPEGWGVDREGKNTRDPEEVLHHGAMLPFGGHKGSAISIMVELLSGPLIGDLMSFESSEHDMGKGCIPYHGAIFISIDPSVLMGENAHDHRNSAEKLFGMIVGQGARLPSQRRYAEREKNMRTGVKVDANILRDIVSLSK